jgi:CubicO group peptidase (beta-lactamase class C family)
VIGVIAGGSAGARSGNADRHRRAAALEGTFHIGTDRVGTPIVNGGACVTARDLARYALLFVRGGRGVAGQQVGSRAFIGTTRTRQGVPYAAPRDWLRYSNHTATDGQCVGHGGYGGQYMLANPDSGVVVVFQRAGERGRLRSGILGGGDPHGRGDHAAPGLG